MNQYFHKPWKRFKEKLNVKVDLCNQAKNADLKNATGIDTSKLALNSNVASLKAGVDKIYVKKIKTVPVNLGRLINVINNNVKKMYINNQLLK